MFSKIEILELLQNYLRWYLETSLVRSFNDYRSNYETIQQNYNPSTARIVCYCYPETAARSARIQKVILTGKDDNVLFLRQAVTDEYWLSRPAQKPQYSGSTPKVSLAAAFIISAPFNMMKASICSLLIGLAIYQGFIWSRSLDTTANPGDSRNVFITFMVGAGSCVLFYLYSFSSKSFENKLPSPSELENRWRVSTREAGHALDAQQHQDNDQAPKGLSAAMKAAAQAHSQCAEAESRVALEYARAFHTEHNDKEEGGLHHNERSEPEP
ncbi:MAG: hypothetical protein Q9204_003219 [Flavoplaca sp. TL-2023a]